MFRALVEGKNEKQNFRWAVRGLQANPESRPAQTCSVVGASLDQGRPAVLPPPYDWRADRPRFSPRGCKGGAPGNRRVKLAILCSRKSFPRYFPLISGAALVALVHGLPGPTLHDVVRAALLATLLFVRNHY